MQSFKYELAAGKASAVIEAPDRAAALRALRQQGITPTSISSVTQRQARKLSTAPESAAETKVQASRQSDHPNRKTVARPGHAGAVPGGMSKGDLSAFIRELATATQAGLPLVPALKTILRQRRRAKERAVIERIVHEVEHGRSLADAAASVGRPFGDLTVSLIRAGELSGRLGEVLSQAATLLERDQKLRRTILASTIYPAFLGVLIAVAVGFIVAVVVPRIMGPLAGRIDPSQLPLPTKIVMFVGDAFARYWWAIALGIALFLIISERVYNTASTRLVIDRTLLKVPVAGRVARDIAVARFTRTLGTLISAGLPALTALKITRGTLGNRAMELVVEEVCEQVSSGKTIAEPMERSGYFPALLTQIVGLGERSGKLPQMIVQAAGVFEEKVETSLKVFTAVLPPVLILFAALAIGVVMAAVLLPLIQMQEMIQ